MILDETKGILTIEGVPICPTDDVKITVGDFYSGTKVTLTFIADVTLIPPKRDSNGKVIYPR